MTLVQVVGDNVRRDAAMREGALCQLGELGSAFAMMMLLDDLVQARGSAAFLQAAPLLGIPSTPGAQA